MTILTENVEVSVGAATETILQHLYEDAQANHEETRSFESFVDHVLMRGKAEIERTWKSADKTKERNKQSAIAAEQLKFIRAKQARGQELNDAEKYFLTLFAALK